MNVCVFIVVLYRNNVGYASTCAFVGQFTGIIISSMSLILLTSEDFSNKYLKISLDVDGILTVKSKSVKKQINPQLI
jgi:PAT family acetyl-CoA transporter-like MFS transporter 1